MNIYTHINQLLGYLLEKQIINKRDVIYYVNSLLQYFQLTEFEGNIQPVYTGDDIEDILDQLVADGLALGLLNNPTQEEIDQFDTGIMGCVIGTPSSILEKFWKLYEHSPLEATRYYYNLAMDTNYIRQHRIAKDEKWETETSYGPLHLTINLSKPEKDPRDIAKAKTMPQDKQYPLCLLCIENENYPGRPGHPARGNLRLIEMELSEERWYLQYSPYVYYNEHCILIKQQHEPMKITPKTFQRMLNFVALFPHYFVGSNADLPIVGGSILSHDHFQGGHYIFPMETAIQEHPLPLKTPGVTSSILHWPMSVLRLRCKDKAQLAEISATVLERWRNYSDPDVGIFSHTEEEPHNTITPIARFRHGAYEIDLVLRNNRRDEAHPYGIFHPRESLHHIKKENIGLIEVMGLAILPARLKKEIQLLKEYMLQQDYTAIANSPELNKHHDFAKAIFEKHSVTPGNIDDILKEEIGQIYCQVLEDAGVFKRTTKGMDAFLKAREVLLEDL